MMINSQYGESHQSIIFNSLSSPSWKLHLFNEKNIGAPIKALEHQEKQLDTKKTIKRLEYLN